MAMSEGTSPAGGALVPQKIDGNPAKGRRPTVAKYNAEQLAALQAKGHTFPGGTSYPIADAEDLNNAIHAVGRGGEDHDNVRKYVMRRAHELGMADRIPPTWQPDGSMSMDDNPPRADLSPRPCERSYLLDDIAIRSDGEGRTVVAYCAVFDQPAEIHDQDGHYMESIAKTAFDKTVSGRMQQIQCFYNHGKTLYGTPSERFSMPLGVPVEIRPDRRGVLTATRYNRNPLADEVLESVRNGDIRGQSFSGRFLPGRSQRTRGANGGLDTIVRSEIAMKEYGPTPMPAYAEAAILGVRTDEMRATLLTLTIEDQVEFLADTLSGLPEGHRAELTRMLMLDTSRDIGTPSPATDAALPEEGTSAATDPPDSVHRSTDQAERRARVLELLRSDI